MAELDKTSVTVADTSVLRRQINELGMKYLAVRCLPGGQFVAAVERSTQLL